MPRDGHANLHRRVAHNALHMLRRDDQAERDLPEGIPKLGFASHAHFGERALPHEEIQVDAPPVMPTRRQNGTATKGDTVKEAERGDALRKLRERV